jgi:hypothetical protein
LIGASESHVAVFDPQEAKVFMVAREGVTMVARPQASAFPAGWGKSAVN